MAPGVSGSSQIIERCLILSRFSEEPGRKDDGRGGQEPKRGLGRLEQRRPRERLDAPVLEDEPPVDLRRPTP